VRAPKHQLPVNKPKRIQLSRKKGWRIPANTVVVSRPSKWGNPFHIRDVIEKFRGEKSLARGEAVLQFRRLITEGSPPFIVSTIRAELRGKNLACWCPLAGPCHADVLLEIANS